MGGFPRSAAEVEAGWIEEKLRARGLIRDQTITEIAWQPIGTGQVGDSARFSLTYDRPGPGPASVVGKFASSDETSRTTAANFGLYAKEVRYYREVRPLLGVRSPEPYGAELADDGAEFVLLFEDMGPARTGNQLEGCSLADARAAIRQAAAIHAPSRNNRAILDLDWLQPAPQVSAQLQLLYPQAHAIFRERYADMLEPELMAVADGLNEHADLWYGRTTQDPGFVHGDFRLDNMLFDVKGGAEEIAIVDWQTAAVGCGLTDVGYFMGCGIGAELRRAHEDELIALYCEEMGRRGVSLTRDAIWDRYRIGSLHGLSTAVFSSAFVVRSERGDANFLSMARGAASLALDHDALGVLKAQAAALA